MITRVGLLAFLLVAAGRAGAQPATTSPVVPYRLVGLVKGQAGNVVADAEVALLVRDSVVRRARSDTTGRFEMDSLTDRMLRIRVRRMGYQAQTVTVTVAKRGRTANLEITLDPTVAVLDTIHVDDDEAPRDRGNPRLVAFKERAATNSFGHYVTEEMIDRVRPQHASDVLRTVPGVVTRVAPPGRIGNIVRLRGCGLKGIGESHEKVGPLVWLDGVRLAGAEIDEVTAGPDIAAIEVYPSFQGVPAQYFDRTAVCGTILVWTKHR